MNYSTNYSMREPVPGEKVKVADINYNTEIIDGVMLDNRQISIDMYDSTSTYNTDDLAGHENSSGRIAVYRCLADNTTGTWDSTKWVQTNLADEITDIRGNAGATTLDDLDDVNLTNPTDGQVLTYDDQNDEWVNSDLPDADVTKTASGNPIEFSDGADAPLVKCVTQITGSQDLHGYDKPWVGGAGKNKLQVTATSQTINGVTFTVNSDGTVLANGTANGNAIFSLCSVLSLSAGEYILSNDFANSKAYLELSGKGATALSKQATFTWGGSETNTPYIAVINGYTANNLLFKPMIRLSTVTDPTFAPYSNICPITAYTEGEIGVSDGDGNITTHTTTFSNSIYQGNADFVGGEVTTEWKKVVFDGTEAWRLSSSGAVNKIFELSISDLKGNDGAADRKNGIIASFIPVSSGTSIGSSMDDKSMLKNNGILYVRNTDCEDTTDFATWINGCEFAYEILTPTTETITPTNLPIKSLFGYNHIESSTGEMEIEYFPAKEQPLIDLIPEASNMHTYSTEEHAVGTWIDGETIYEQTYTYSGTGAANPFQTTIDMTGKNLIEVIQHYARYTYNSGESYGECVGAELIYSNCNTLNVRYVDSAPYTLTVSSFLGNATESYDIAFTLRYTKQSTRSLAKSEPQEEQVEELKEEPSEETKEEPEEVKEEPVEEVKEEETKEEGEVNER